jgi:hypothetical protein
MSGSGSRDQFGAVVLLGDAGAETKQMLFDGDSREHMRAFGYTGGRGVGWLSLNGGTARPVRVPKIENWRRLHDVITSGVNAQ